MHDSCDIVAYVQSERTVIAAREVRGLRPQIATLGLPVYLPTRTVTVTYGRRLPDEHAAALEQARRLASETGTILRVVDLGRSNLLARILRMRLLGDPALPAIIVKGTCRWDRLGSGASASLRREARA